MKIRDLPDFRYVFHLSDGDTIICSHQHARRVINQRGQFPPEVVWEVLHNNVWRELWPEQIASFEQEQI